MIRVGSFAPEFSIPLDTGERFRLSELRGARPLVLMFLPSAHSVDVRREGYEFLQHIREVEALGAVLLAVSPEDLAPLREFLKLYDIRCATAKDSALELSHLYRVVWLRGSAIRRATFVIDAGGIVRAALHHELVPRSHWNGITRALRAVHGPSHTTQEPDHP